MKDHQTVLWVAVAWLVLGYVTALWYFPDLAHLGMSGLFALALWDLHLRRPHPLSLRLRQPDAFLGGMVVGLLGLLNLQFNSFYLIRVTPWLGGLGIVLLGFGRMGLRPLWRELILLFFLGFPSAIGPLLPDPSPLAAQFGGGVLRLVGVEVAFIQGTQLVLPSGAVEVFRGCSGLEYMTYLLGLAILCLMLFPISGTKRLGVPLVGIALGFVVNGLRVALLAVLASEGEFSAFDYWHEGPGSLLFGGLAVILFGLFYGLLLRTAKTPGRENP